jgi:hypothetical protein
MVRNRKTMSRPIEIHHGYKSETCISEIATLRKHILPTEPKSREEKRA